MGFLLKFRSLFQPILSHRRGEVEGLAEGADLVRQAEEEALPEPGEDQVHGEHVGGDHVPLDGSQGKIPPRVAQGEARVAEAVEPVAGVGVVPVIEEVVVEQPPRTKSRS